MKGVEGSNLEGAFGGVPGQVVEGVVGQHFNRGAAGRLFKTGGHRTFLSLSFGLLARLVLEQVKNQGRAFLQDQIQQLVDLFRIKI